MAALRIVTPSPIGPLAIEAGEDAVTRVELHAPVGATTGRAEPLVPVLDEACRQLAAYFAGELTRFSIPLAPRGTVFQREVWTALQDIPYGQTQSYRDLAALIGRPAATRAVGAANGANPIPIFIPCHRVIGSDGRLVGFGGGLDTKRRLLALEQGLVRLL